MVQSNFSAFIEPKNNTSEKIDDIDKIEILSYKDKHPYKTNKLKNYNYLISGPNAFHSAMIRIISNIQSGKCHQAIVIESTTLEVILKAKIIENLISRLRKKDFLNFKAIYGNSKIHLLNDTSEIIIMNAKYLNYHINKRDTVYQSLRNPRYLVVDEPQNYDTSNISLLHYPLAIINPGSVYLLAPVVNQMSIKTIKSYLFYINKKKIFTYKDTYIKLPNDHRIIKRKFIDSISYFANLIIENSITIVYSNTNPETDKNYSSFKRHIENDDQFKKKKIKLINYHSETSDEDKKKVIEILDAGDSCIIFTTKSLHFINSKNVKLIIHSTLPNSTYKLYQREAIYSKWGKSKRPNIYICMTNEYDKDICKNERNFQLFLDLPVEKFIPDPKSLIFKINNLVFKKSMKFDLTNEEEAILYRLNITNDIGYYTHLGKTLKNQSTEFLTPPKSVIVLNNEIETITIELTFKNVILRYQPGTFHLIHGKLFKVRSWNVDQLPVFDLVDEDSEEYSEYFGPENLQTFVRKEFFLELDENYSSILSLIKIFPLEVIQMKGGRFVYLGTRINTTKSVELVTLHVRIYNKNWTQENLELVARIIIDTIRKYESIGYNELRFYANENYTLGGEKTAMLLLYETELSGILLKIDTDQLYSLSLERYTECKEQIEREGWENRDIKVFPLPTPNLCKKNDFNNSDHVEEIIRAIFDQVKMLQTHNKLKIIFKNFT